MALSDSLERLDDGNAARHRRLEVQGDVALLGELGERDPVLGEQRLVGGDDVLACAQRRFDGRFRHPVRAADQLDEHPNRRIARERHGVVEPAQAVGLDAAVLILAARRHPDDAQLTADPLLETVLVVLEQVEQACPDGAKAGDAQGERLLHRNVMDYRLAFCGIGITLCIVSGA